MDTNLFKEQLAFIANEIADQSVMQPKRFKFAINSKLLDRFGSKGTAYKKVLFALLWIQKNQDKNNMVLTLHAEKNDKQEQWFDISVEKDFKEFVRQINDLPAESLSFDSRKGILNVNGKIFEIDPGSRKSVILRLCIHRPGTRVGFNRISDTYDKNGFLSNKQIYDDIRTLNKMIKNDLPEITEFIKVKKDFASINIEQVT